MDAKAKVLDFFPVTTTKSVYMDGTSKTLHEAIQNGEIGGGNTGMPNNSVFVTDAIILCGDLLFSTNRITKEITINLNKKLPLNRIMVVNYSNGTNLTDSIIDGTKIADGEYLVWDKINKFTTGKYNEGMKVPSDKVLVGINWNGKITGGILLDAYNKIKTMYDKEYNVVFQEVNRAVSETLHSMFVLNNELITLEVESLGGTCVVYSLPELVKQSTFKCSFIEDNADGSTSELRLVACDYSSKVDALIMGNSTSTGHEEHMKGYIFYNAKNWKNSSEAITFTNCGEYTLLDFPENLFPKEYTAKLCWAEEENMCYFTTSNLECCHKLLLGVGTNKLEHGIYNYSTNKKYNGTYKIINSYNQEMEEGNKDLQFYKGCLYYPIKYTKGGLRIIKSYLLNDKKEMKKDLINYNPIDQSGNPMITGSPEGIVIYKDKIYASHATYGKFYVLDLI